MTTVGVANSGVAVAVAEAIAVARISAPLVAVTVGPAGKARRVLEPERRVLEKRGWREPAGASSCGLDDYNCYGGRTLKASPSLASSLASPSTRATTTSAALSSSSSSPDAGSVS